MKQKMTRLLFERKMFMDEPMDGSSRHERRELDVSEESHCACRTMNSVLGLVPSVPNTVKSDAVKMSSAMPCSSIRSRTLESSVPPHQPPW